eukprot:TRINITY_DN5182_c0_g2_i1.p1 TRINITY_DN5182_c0_g2~~TRINITY_DN5182_c0_g2_i1.p1  ORF type:complete len:305 (+),score=74.24 TRINITY_DN5182_c0_g2_i1:105-917(+)
MGIIFFSLLTVVLMSKISGATAEFEQEVVWSKNLCCVCVGQDKFQSTAGEITEESSWLHRNIVFNCCNILQKNMRLNGAGLTIEQEPVLTVLKGSFQEVKSGPNHIGKVGLPFSHGCFKFNNGCLPCLATYLVCCLGCSCMRIPIMMRAYVNEINCGCCCLTKCRTLPALAIEANGNTKYKVDAPFLQLGVLFGGCLPIDPCRTVNFDIKDPGTDQPVGKIVRYDKTPAICLWCKANNHFKIEYPQNANQQDKELLFATAISLFTLYFDI